jgi:hypothetical protein
VRSAEKKSRLPPVDCRMSTGKKRTNAISASRASGAHENNCLARPARRKPTPMPRKLPSSTKFEKYDRYTTLEPVQRISASSTNSIKKLSRISRSRSFIERQSKRCRSASMEQNERSVLGDRTLTVSDHSFGTTRTRTSRSVGRAPAAPLLQQNDDVGEGDVARQSALVAVRC